MERVVIRIPDGTYENYNAVDNVIAYILRLDNMRLIGGYGIIPMFTRMGHIGHTGKLKN